MIDKTRPLPKTLFPFIWHFLKPHRSIVIVCIMLAVAAGFWGPFNSMLIKSLINLVPSATGDNLSILIAPASLIVINFILFDNVTWRGINYIWAKFVPVIINNMLAETLNYVLSHPHQFYQNQLSGKLAKQMGHLADGITKIITSSSANFLRAASLLLTAFLAAYFVNPIFCLILVTWFVCFASISIFMSKKLITLSDIQASTESIVMGEIVDVLSNNASVRIFSRKSYENERMIPFFRKQQNAYTTTSLYSTLLYCVQGSLIACMMAFSIYFLIYLYGKSLVTVGDFVLILGLSMETGYMMWFTMSELDEFNKALGRCKQGLNALISPITLTDSSPARLLTCQKGKITFKQLGFHYQGAEPLFKDLSIEILPGQKVGLVGFSGSGKSTFVNLLMRFFDVTHGAILIDDQNIQDVTQDSLRENIAMIPQDPSLFHRSLMENIRYGRTNASDAEVIEAAKKAHSHEFISALPQAYDSLVGERGVKLSGGQRQRIAIARAILKNAPILIFDEATSQLDSVTENLIQESLWELMHGHNKASGEGGKTTLVIAHRLSTLLHMDRILVFDKGKIVEDGTHLELLAKGGLYKHLWDAQVGGFLGDHAKSDDLSHTKKTEDES